MRFKSLVIFAISILSYQFSSAQSFYNIDTIQHIEIYFSQSNWDYQLDTSRLGSDGYVMADWVKINAQKFDSVGVKYKGNSSYDSSYTKNPIHIELDTYKSQSYQGYKDIKLGNGYADPSMIREVLSYKILANYMVCPQANFTHVIVNGKNLGIYSNVESITKTFCTDHFNVSKNIFIKCNPIVNPGPNNKCNLKYVSADSSKYFNNYEIKSKYGWNELVALSDSVTNHASNIASIMDMDRVIWMLAFNHVLVNLDSYSGVFCQNYYLYKDINGRFCPIIWDLNMSLGGFPFLGSSNSSMGSLTIANMQQLPLNIHSSDSYWPLIQAVWNNTTYKKMYIAHVKTISKEMFENTNYETYASQIHNILDSAVKADSNKFYSYTQFQNGMTDQVSVGSYQVPGIKTLMSNRISFLNASTEFLYTAPTISNVNAIAGFKGSVSNINVQVSNADVVYIGFRFNQTLKFSRMMLYDDGLHQDGTAGDGVYGNQVYMQDDNMQYYIYSENNKVGKFYPERAEYEFLNLAAENGIATIENKLTQLHVYPNPSNTGFSIQCGQSLKTDVVNIYNAQGKLIYQENAKPFIYINTENWPNGVYFLEGTNQKSLKVIVAH